MKYRRCLLWHSYRCWQLSQIIQICRLWHSIWIVLLNIDNIILLLLSKTVILTLLYVVMFIFLLVRLDETKAIVVVSLLLVLLGRNKIWRSDGILFLVSMFHGFDRLLVVDFIKIWLVLLRIFSRFISCFIIINIIRFDSMTDIHFLSLIKTLMKSSRLKINRNISGLLSSDFQTDKTFLQESIFKHL